MHQYRTSRLLFGLAEFAGWSMFVVGVVTALAGLIGGNSMFGRGGGMVAALPGLVLIVAGIYTVVMAQIGRAAVHTAQMTGKLLENSNEELRRARTENFAAGSKAPLLQKQAASPPPQVVPKPAQPAAAPRAHQTATRVATAEPVPTPPPQPTNRAVEHLGRTIVIEGEFWKVDGERFENLEAARAHIEATTLRAER